MTIDEVRAWLAENKDTEEVKKFFESISPKKTLTADEVTAFLGTEEGKAIIDPMIDKRITDAVKKRDKYHEDRFEVDLKKKLAAEILKLEPKEETAEQKQIKELARKFEESEKARAEESLKTRITSKAHEMGVDPLFVADMNFQSEDEAVLWMKRVIDRDKALKDKVSNELLASGYKPGSGTNGPGGKSKPDLSKLSKDEIFKLEMEGKLDDMLRAQ